MAFSGEVDAALSQKNASESKEFTPRAGSAKMATP
jgi:hypothetical protein